MSRDNKTPCGDGFSHKTRVSCSSLELRGAKKRKKEGFFVAGKPFSCSASEVKTQDMYSSCESSEIDEQWLSTVWSHACPRTPRRSVTLSVFSLSVTLHHFCLHLHLSPLFFSTNTHVHVHTKWHGSMTHSFSALGHLSNYKHHRSWRDSAGRRRTGGRGQGMSVFDKQLAEALFLWRNLDMFCLLKQSANKHKQQ